MTAPRSPIDWRSVVVGGCSALVLGCVAMVVLALGAGYRPVVITTGSMGDAAPAGSLVIAAPSSSADIEVGDVVVMRRPGTAPVTHRVIELWGEPGGTVAVTRGDANPAPDSTPYPLGDDELVARWIVPGLGGVVEAIRDPRTVLAVLGVVVLAGCVLVLRRIWTGGGHHESGPTGGAPGRPLPPPQPGTHAPVGSAASRAATDRAADRPFPDSTILPRPARGRRSRHGGPHGVGLRSGAEPVPARRSGGADPPDPRPAAGRRTGPYVLGAP